MTQNSNNANSSPARAASPLMQRILAPIAMDPQVVAGLREFNARQQQQSTSGTAWAVTGGEFPKTPEGHPDTNRAFQLLGGCAPG